MMSLPEKACLSSITFRVAVFFSRGAFVLPQYAPDKMRRLYAQHEMMFYAIIRLYVTAISFIPLPFPE